MIRYYKYINILIYLLLSVLISQQLPYGEPYYKENQIKRNIHQIDIEIPFVFPESIFENVQPVKYQNRFILLSLHINIRLIAISNIPHIFKVEV